jgi:hypothetical protein
VFPAIATLPDEATVLPDCPDTGACEVNPNEAEPGKRTGLVTMDEVAPEKKHHGRGGT